MTKTNLRFSIVRTAQNRSRITVWLIVVSLVCAPPLAWASDPDLSYDFFADMSGFSTAFIDKQNQMLFLGAVGATVLSHQYDDRARDFFKNQNRIGDWEKLGNDVLGTGVPGAVMGGLLWSAGKSFQSARAVQAGQAGIEAIAITGIATAALKGSAQRERPDGSDRYSFPSGHTSTVAATAMTLQEFYGWRAGVPAFMLTALTAAGRMGVDKHWLSDTVAGASLGILIAHSVARPHLARLPGSGAEASHFVLMPVIDGSDARVISVYNF